HHICRSTSCATSRAGLGRPSKTGTVSGPRTSDEHADGAAASCPRKVRKRWHGSCQPRTRLPLSVPGRSTTSGSYTAPAGAVVRLMPRPRLGSDVSFLTLTPNRHGVVQPASPARSISRHAPGLPERSWAAATRPLLDPVRAHLLRVCTIPQEGSARLSRPGGPGSKSRRLPRVSVSLHCDVLQGKLELGRSVSSSPVSLQ
ncbi:hypothetical protein C8T65DRAFT_650182, partial [Cerioporus squamosus]